MNAAPGHLILLISNLRRRQTQRLGRSAEAGRVSDTDSAVMPQPSTQPLLSIIHVYVVVSGVQMLVQMKW